MELKTIHITDSKGTRHVPIYPPTSKQLMPRPGLRPVPMGGVWMGNPRRARWVVLVGIVGLIVFFSLRYHSLSSEVLAMFLLSVAAALYIGIGWLDYRYSAAGMRRAEMVERKRRFDEHLKLLEVRHDAGS